MIWQQRRPLRPPRGTSAPEAGPVILAGRRIFIMPDRNGTLFGFVFLVMLLGALNDNHNLGLAVAALLAAILLVSILHTYRNLRGLHLTANPAPPVFVGEQARFPITLSDPEGAARFGLHLVPAGAKNRPPEPGADPGTNLPSGTAIHLQLTEPAPQRGWQAAGQFTLSTRFPLGLVVAWSSVCLQATCLVYPRPESGHPPLPVTPGSQGESDADRGRDGSDFIGLRLYRPGDPPRSIHWKRSAQLENPVVKQFGGESPRLVWFTWDTLPGLDTEVRIARLCRWVLDAHHQGVHYGLDIPGTRLPPARNEQHRHRCLKALALFHVELDHAHS